MTPRHVGFTLTAKQHVARAKAWWLENRDYPDVFADELEQALKFISLIPAAGTVYSTSPVPGVRRVYLRRVDLHLYYTFNEETVVVRALWGARRQRGPRLEP